MSKLLTYKDTKEQSEAVFNQFGKTRWIPMAKLNAKLPRKPSDELKFSGVGKTLLCVGMGASLEEHIDTIRKYRDKVDIIACDKSFAVLMEHGIKPNFVMICDTNIETRHFDKYSMDTKGVGLIATPYANHLWTYPWMGDRYFYVNKDSIESEQHFKPIMGDIRVIPASSNVTNAMVVYMTGCDDETQFNWAGYEKYLLVGYDYSWRPDGNYYAFANPKPKRFYMNHLTMMDINGDIVFTSANLRFSARWLIQYANFFNLPVVNCSGRGLLHLRYRGKLEDELKRISSDPRRIESTRLAFKAARDSFQVYQQAKESFERQREALLCQ